MMKIGAADSKSVIISKQNTEDQMSYLQQLKDAVFDELLSRIEGSNEITDAVDILYTAKKKLNSVLSNSKIVLLAFKPICLLFLFEAYQATPTNI